MRPLLFDDLFKDGRAGRDADGDGKVNEGKEDEEGVGERVGRKIGAAAGGAAGWLAGAGATGGSKGGIIGGASAGAIGGEEVGAWAGRQYDRHFGKADGRAGRDADGDGILNEGKKKESKKPEAIGAVIGGIGAAKANRVFSFLRRGRKRKAAAILMGAGFGASQVRDLVERWDKAAKAADALYPQLAKDGRAGRDADSDGIINEGKPNETSVSGEKPNTLKERVREKARSLTNPVEQFGRLPSMSQEDRARLARTPSHYRGKAERLSDQIFSHAVAPVAWIGMERVARKLPIGDTARLLTTIAASSIAGGKAGGAVSRIGREYDQRVLEDKRSRIAEEKRERIKASGRALPQRPQGNYEAALESFGGLSGSIAGRMAGLKFPGGYAVDLPAAFALGGALGTIGENAGRYVGSRLDQNEGSYSHAALDILADADRIYQRAINKMATGEAMDFDEAYASGFVKDALNDIYDTHQKLAKAVDQVYPELAKDGRAGRDADGDGIFNEGKKNKEVARGLKTKVEETQKALAIRVRDSINKRPQVKAAAKVGKKWGPIAIDTAVKVSEAITGDFNPMLDTQIETALEHAGSALWYAKERAKEIARTPVAKNIWKYVKRIKKEDGEDFTAMERVIDRMLEAGLEEGEVGGLMAQAANLAQAMDEDEAEWFVNAFLKVMSGVAAPEEKETVLSLFYQPEGENEED